MAPGCAVGLRVLTTEELLIRISDVCCRRERLSWIDPFALWQPGNCPVFWQGLASLRSSLSLSAVSSLLSYSDTLYITIRVI